MKNKKIKLWKIFLIILTIIICIYAIFTLYRFYILTKINKMNMKYMEKTNYCITQENGEIVKTYWKKDNICKVNIMSQKSNNENFSGNVFWYDVNTGEGYRYIESEKKYQDDDNAKWEVMPDYNLIMPVKTESIGKTLLNSMNIFNTLKIGNLNEKKCYIFKYKNGEEIYIDKETGLCLSYTYKVINKYNDNGNMKDNETISNLYFNYSFGTVENENVFKPDFSGYQLTKF